MERSHAIVGVRKISAGKKRANIRLIAEFTRHSQHSIRRTSVVRTAAESQSRLAVIDNQCAQCPFAELSRHAAAELGVGYLPRKKEIDESHEKPRVLNER